MNGLTKKKVLIITVEPFPYGMAGTNRIISLAKGFIANGLDVQILGTYKYGMPDDIMINPKKGIYEGIKFTNIYNSTVKNHFKLIRIFNEFCKAGLVFLYCLKNLGGDTLVLYYSPESLPAIAAKFVTIIRDTTIIKEETEHPLVRVINNYRISKYFFLRCHYKIFDGLFVITNNLYRFFKDEMKYKKPIHILPMIVDVDRFKHEISMDNNSIVFSGILDDKKEGVDILIKAFSKVLRIYPNYTLNLYGTPSNDAQESRYKEMISDLGIGCNVVIHGYKIRDEMTEIFQKASIFVFTRPASLQATYGFSTKLGEYLAAGKPLVATRVGEIEMFLQDRKNAFLCDANADSIANKICEIIGDYTFALKVAEEGRSCALEHFNNKTETNKAIIHFQGIYNKINRNKTKS